MKKAKDDEFPIDFVIPWVDGSDPEWIAEFNKYAPKEKRPETDASEQRYRDYGLLRYWFRGVEKFAPWVRTVHFVTCGQKPDWLNLDAPKLHWVKHSDYIPQEYLPVFSANPIELMMHKIPGLAECFVYFNDDFFLTAPVKRDFFFKNGMPRDAGIMNATSSSAIGSIILNDITEINAHFNKKNVLLKNLFKFFNLRYGINLIRNFCLLPFPRFTGFHDHHFSQSYTKSLLCEVWEYCGVKLDETMHSRFRNLSDVNQWLFHYWQLCKGSFFPKNMIWDRKLFTLWNSNIDEICAAIEKQKYREIVINEGDVQDFDYKMSRLSDSFNKILGEKSSFEI